MYRLVPMISGLLGWWLEFIDVIHPVEETIGSGGRVKSDSSETARRKSTGQFPYLDQTLRRTSGEQALKTYTSRASVPR